MVAIANIGYFKIGGISVVESIVIKNAVVAMLAVGFFVVLLIIKLFNLYS